MEGESVPRQFPDVAVVADDARQGATEQLRPLPPGKHSFSLPPEPARIQLVAAIKDTQYIYTSSKEIILQNVSQKFNSSTHTGAVGAERFILRKSQGNLDDKLRAVLFFLSYCWFTCRRPVVLSSASRSGRQRAARFSSPVAASPPGLRARRQCCRVVCTL